MRLNKFRSYNENDMCFYYFINGGYFNEKGETAHRWCFNWENAEQFTGLHDKNGKEIYERDVVKIDWHYDDDIEIKEMFAEVIFTCGSFMAVNKDKNYWIDLDNNLITVIGNVFENPELIK